MIFLLTAVEGNFSGPLERLGNGQQYPARLQPALGARAFHGLALVIWAR